MAGGKLFVIADNLSASKFFIDVLDEVAGYDEVTVLNCTNTVTKKNLAKHFAYYALNVLAIRNPQTRYVPLSTSGKKIARVIDFASIYDGAWQSLPADILTLIAADKPDAILKFGMSLMRIPAELTAPVLSFHHGDPDHYRGRPAGFYEMLHGAPVVGQIVQVLTNKLDAGGVVAFGETKVHPHSYRATLIESFRHSKLLINAALVNARAGRVLDKPCKGTNYRLPSNLLVARFCAAMAAKFVRRLAYGAAFEKDWKVSTAPLAGADLTKGEFPDNTTWTTLEQGPEHAFYADPFFCADGILVEALNRATGKGEVLWRKPGQSTVASDSPGHWSYPGVVTEDGIEYIVPETAQWAAPAAYRLVDGKLVNPKPLDIQGDPRILDPTLVYWKNRLYLFGNLKSHGSQALCLWSAPDLFGRFEAHPQNPIRVSPRGSRMAGGAIAAPTGLVRFGQSYLGDYGDGVFAFAIEELTQTAYREREIAAIRFAHVRGPHTVNVKGGEVVFDWYLNRFSPLAGWRRLKGRAA